MGKPYRVAQMRAIGGRVGGSASPADHRAPIPGCGLFPWLEDAVDHAIEVALDSGVRSPEAAAIIALQEVYPYTPDDEDLRWPAVRGDAFPIIAIQDRVIIRARLIVAARDDIEASKAWQEGGGL